MAVEQQNTKQQQQQRQQQQQQLNTNGKIMKKWWIYGWKRNREVDSGGYKLSLVIFALVSKLSIIRILKHW